MRRVRETAVWFVAVVLSGTACDRMPLDAAIGEDAFELLAGDGAGIPVPLSSPGLLGSALMKVYADEGVAAVWTRSAELRRLREVAQEGGDAGKE
jgi:hypothetical protein